MENEEDLEFRLRQECEKVRFVLQSMKSISICKWIIIIIIRWF